MQHVKDIQPLVDAGESEEAHEALDQLLELGPKNLEALKLRARLYAYEGDFDGERATWEKVAHVDNEDPDAISYFLHRQLEDRELIYFTEDLPQGGRRFLAYSRTLVNTSALGLLGCMVFLFLTQFGDGNTLLGSQVAMLALFGVCVIWPWVRIVRTYLTSLRSIAVSPSGVTLSTRLRTWSLPWKDLEHVFLARSGGGRSHLSLVFLPRNENQPGFEVDFEAGSSPVKARPHLIEEIRRQFAEPPRKPRSGLPLGERKILSF